jgi:hypothetical protein
VPAAIYTASDKTLKKGETMEKFDKVIDSIKLTKRDFAVFGVNAVLIFMMVVLQHMNLKAPHFVEGFMGIFGR